jgi:regulator of cell morphogenesis and NO signaling
MSLSPEMSVAAIVTEHPECAQVLHRNRIDFCCHGEVSLAAACASKGIEMDPLRAALEQAIEERDAKQPDAAALPAGELVAHIVEQHHGYLRRTLPWIEHLVAKVAAVHGEHNAKLVGLDEAFQRFADTLVAHVEEEEADLFPALARGGLASGELRTRLDAMTAEHREVGRALEELRALADDYRVPDWACRSYRTLFAELEQLEADTHRHIHLENHVLAPRFRA